MTEIAGRKTAPKPAKPGYEDLVALLEEVLGCVQAAACLERHDGAYGRIRAAVAAAKGSTEP